MVVVVSTGSLLSLCCILFCCSGKKPAGHSQVASGVGRKPASGVSGGAGGSARNAATSSQIEQYKAEVRHLTNME